MAHGLSLGGIVCEYIKDASGKIFLISVLKTDWASQGGHPSGSLGKPAGVIPELDEQEDAEDDELGIIHEDGLIDSGGKTELAHHERSFERMMPSIMGGNDSGDHHPGDGPLVNDGELSFAMRMGSSSGGSLRSSGPRPGTALLPTQMPHGFPRWVGAYMT